MPLFADALEHLCTSSGLILLACAKAVKFVQSFPNRNRKRPCYYSIPCAFVACANKQLLCNRISCKEELRRGQTCFKSKVSQERCGRQEPARSDWHLLWYILLGEGLERVEKVPKEQCTASLHGGSNCYKAWPGKP